MQNTKKYAKFMLVLGALTITAAPALARPVKAPKKELGITEKKARKQEVNSYLRAKCRAKQVMYKKELGITDCNIIRNYNNKKVALKKAGKQGINPYLIAKCCAKQVMHNKAPKNAAKVAIAKHKLNKQFFGKKAKFDNKANHRKKAFKRVINKARPQNKEGKAKGFFKNLFTGFLGMKMGK